MGRIVSESARVSEGLNSGGHVRRFIREKGAKLVELLREKPLEDAEWQRASHGAWLRVHGEHGDLFERLLVVVVRADDRPVDWFREWAEQRINQLGAYMEACNTGRVVRILVRDGSATGVLVRRIGRDPNQPDTELPPSDDIAGVLGDFVRDIERYLLHMGDDELRYIRAIRLFQIPRKAKPPLFLLGLDPLPTVVGLEGDPVSIRPLSLVRGVLAELAEQMAERRDGLSSTRSVTRPVHFAKTAPAVKRVERLVEGLDGLCADIDAIAPPLQEVREALYALQRALR